MGNSTYLHEVIARRPLNWDYVPVGSFDSFKFEEVDLDGWQKYISDNWKFALYIAPIYLTTIFGLQLWMRDRPAFNLKMPLFLWNLALGIFSIFGFLRTAPTFFYVLQKPDGMFHSLCTREDMSVPMGFWIILFCLSKFVELGDTVFIVLRKKPLLFLQWYHHLVTLAISWLMGPLGEPISRYYIVLNYGVHSLMYPYFAMKAVDVNVPKSFAHLITTLQLTQMLIGVLVNVLSVALRQIGYDCFRHPDSIKACLFLYGSFTVLFGKLFVDLVLRQDKKKLKKND